jgi:glutathione S-transferase
MRLQRCVQKLESEFPDHTPLLPEPESDAAAVSSFLDSFNDVSGAIFKVTSGNTQQEIVSTLNSFLNGLEEQIARNGGPYLFGKFSLADITVAPFLPDLMLGTNEEMYRCKYPHVHAAMGALMQRSSFQATAVDAHSRAVIRRAFFGHKREVCWHSACIGYGC